MTPAQLDAAAEAFARRYRGLLTSMIASLAGIFDRPNAATARGAHDLRENTFQEVLAFLGYSNETLRAMTSNAVEAGISIASSDLSEENSKRLEELTFSGRDDLQSDLMGIAFRDWVTVRRAHRRFTLETDLQRRRFGAAAERFVRQGKIADLKFRQLDRAGRQWESGIYVRNLVRHYLVQMQADCACFARAKQGGDTLVATWGDDRAPIKFSISGGSEELPPYVPDIREGVFHPNSTARLELP